MTPEIYIILTIFISQNVIALEENHRICIYSMVNSKAHNVTAEISDETTEEPQDPISDRPVVKYSHDGVQYVQCPSNAHNCYALWYEDGNGTLTIMGQGCWEQSGKPQDCERSQCVSDRKPSKINNTKFCCCSGDYCNVNFTDIYVSVPEDPPPPATSYLEQSQREHQKMIVWVSTFCSFVLATFCFACICLAWKKRSFSKSKDNADQAHLMGNSPGYTVGMYSVDHLKLESLIGQGRYGSVWKGIVNDQEVAVKIFPAHYRSYFYNERDIYCLPFMDHPGLLTYFGCDERTNLDGHMEYLLVLSYAPNGCLQQYLSENLLDFPTFCKMGLSIAKGLAYLHTDIMKGDKIKPCVTHRDLNSRNILVKQDLSCCICDLGFAMKISGARYYHNGEEQHAETKSINEVGTRRYMAPEILEGAVNLRDCETSLKQIDVYALGLVLWELATRTNDFYQVQVTELPPYMLPFQQEIGLHPTMEQMQGLVSRRKARPLFPAQWKDSSAARLVRDTIEDCWDQDAEARLTALCVEERLSELPLLRDRNYRTTIYSNSPTNQSTPGIINNNHLNSNTFTQNNHDNENSGNQSVKENYDLSEGTVETILTMSPSEHPEHNCKNSNQTANGFYGQFKPVQLQPFQGRNPCLERNLMLATDSSDNLQYGNSNFIDKSFKHNTNYSSSNTTESQGLITHDYLGQNGYNLGGNRSITPIPYVQNVVYDIHSNGLPKQQNSSINEHPKKFKWNGLRKLIDRKIFGRERLEHVSNEESPKSNLISDNILNKRPTEHVVMETQVNLVPGKVINGIGNQIITSVLQDENTHKRPSTLPLINVSSNSNSSSNSPSISSDSSSSDQERSSSTEKVVRRKRVLEHSESNPLKDKRLSLLNDEMKTSDSTSGISQLIKQKNTIQKQQSLEQFNEVFSSTGDLSRMKDPSQRIKTPGDVPPSVRRNRGKNLNNAARFSLYDDRMMTIDCTHWSSVPDDIDITFEPALTENDILKPPEVESLK